MTPLERPRRSWNDSPWTVKAFAAIQLWALISEFFAPVADEAKLLSGIVIAAAAVIGLVQRFKAAWWVIVISWALGVISGAGRIVNGWGMATKG